MTTFAKMKLGKQAPANDPKDLLFSKYADLTLLPPSPTTLQNNQGLFNWGMMGNDVAGDCTMAAGGHAIMSWTDSAGSLFIPSRAEVIGAYSALTGYNPSNGQNDNGATCNDALNYMKQVGISGHKILAYTKINNHYQLEVKASIHLFELLYIGVSLPLSAQNQLTRWSVTDTSLKGKAAPGSWGGHCVVVVGYNPDGVDIITWGQRIRVTWGFWATYVDEAFAILSPDFFNKGVAINGFNLPLLQQDLSLLK